MESGTALATAGGIRLPSQCPPHALALLSHRPNGALESCSFARHSLLQTLYKV